MFLVVCSVKGVNNMEFVSKFFLEEEEKDVFIDALTPELQTLRAKADISQEELANIIGVSRQTYGTIERKTRKMSWTTYLSLILFYDYNKSTHSMVRSLDAFPHELIKRFNGGDASVEVGVDLSLGDNRNIFSSLDERAMSTIKTVLTMEYSRCNNVPSDAVVKFFEGIDFSVREDSDSIKRTTGALKNIKRKK